MARVVSAFQFIGSLGNITASAGMDGKIIARQKVAYVHNPRTEKQQTNRSKLKLAAQVAGMLGVVGQTSLKANGFPTTRRGQLIKRLYDQIYVDLINKQVKLPFGLSLVNVPTYNPAVTAAVANATGKSTLTVTGAGEGDMIAKAILVFDTVTGNWRCASEISTSSTLNLNDSPAEADHSIEIYGYAILLSPTSEDALGNVGPTAADGTAFIISTDIVNNDNYLFSESFCAHTNVTRP